METRGRSLLAHVNLDCTYFHLSNVHISDSVNYDHNTRQWGDRCQLI